LRHSAQGGESLALAISQNLPQDFPDLPRDFRASSFLGVPFGLSQRHAELDRAGMSTL
jgi:hypothetical protein